MIEEPKNTGSSENSDSPSHFVLTLLGLPGRIRTRFFPNEDELGPVKQHHLDSFGRSVERYQRFYDLPDEITNRANKVDIHFVTRRQLDFFLEHEIRRDFRAWLSDRPSTPETREIAANLQRQIDRAIDNHTKAHGVTTQVDDRIKILILPNSPEIQEAAVDHETLHALSRRPSSKDSGFLTAGEDWGLLRKPYIGRSINETATEVLRLVESNSKLRISALYDAINQEQVTLGYKDSVTLLLQLIISAERHIGQSFDIRETVPLYFGFNNLSSEQARTQFITNLESSLPSDEKSILDFFTRN